MGEIAINSHFTQKIDWRAYQHQMRHIFLIKYTTCMRDFFSQSERLKRRKVNTSTILTTPSLKWRWYHLSTIITVLSVTISLQIIFAHIAFYAYSLAQWRSHVMVLAFLVSLKLCETSMGQHLSPRWGHVILVNGYPVLTTFPWCGRQMDRGTDKWLPKFKFLGWIIKEPNFVSYEAKLAPPRAPVELR